MADRTSSFPPEPDVDDVCALPLVRRVAALLDQEPDDWRVGMALPRGWEFILFGATTRQSELAHDGHSLPPPPFADGQPTKVMLGGRRFRFHAPIPVGAAVRRSSMIAAVNRKEGRAGAMTIVTRLYRTTLAAGGALAMEEEEDMVYRAVDQGVSRKGAEAAPPPTSRPADAECPYRADETMLFRYSALGNNAHRIHYDQRFATEVEGWPGLVVNGGLTSLMLVELFRAHVGREPVSIATRMMRPLFCGSSNMLRIAAVGDGWRAWAENERGEEAGEAMIA